MDGTEAFFHAMAPVLVANIFTACAIAAIWMYAKHRSLMSLWLLALPFLFALYGLYLWQVHPLRMATQSAPLVQLAVPSADAATP